MFAMSRRRERRQGDHAAASSILAMSALHFAAWPKRGAAGVSTMRGNSRWFINSLLCLFALLAPNGIPAQAATYPAKPVKFIVAVGAASTPDVIARIIADRLAKVWGQQVLIINRPGGGGLIAAQAAATSEPDGYTLYFGISSTFLVLPETQDKLPFDLQRDLAPIGLVSEGPLLFAAASALRVNTLADTIALAKTKPDGLLYVANFRGSLPHMTGELFARRAAITLTHVPYPGIAPALNEVLSGRIGLIVEAMSGLSGAIAGGSVRPLAVTSVQRLSDFPDLPTVSETIPGFEAKGWFVLMAPSGVSPEIIRKLNHDLNGVLAQDELQRTYRTLGVYARPMSPAETAAFIRGEQDLWRPIVGELVKAQ
jgi:tripartite-type tricarboxylate transporter receptor subunit TctC